MKPRRTQIDSLTGLRGVAACWVMLMHFREVTPTRVFEFPVLDKAIANGAYGVDVFFVLSGFILCHVYGASFRTRFSAHKIRQFIVYRFARIYPVHLVTFALMMLLFSVKSLTSENSVLPDRYDPLTVLTTLTLTNAWVPGLQTPNMPAWSVSAEWFAYSLFPGLCFLLSWKRWVPAVYTALGLGLALLQPLGNYCLTHVLSGFLIGMAASGIVPTLPRLALGRLTALGIVIAVVVWAEQTDPSVPVGLLLFSALILALTNQSDFVGRFLSARAILYLGEISYSIYMVHWPMRVIGRNCLQVLGILEVLSPPLVVCIYVLVTLAAAVASYRYVELPGRALLRKAGNYVGGPLPGAVRLE